MKNKESNQFISSPIKRAETILEEADRAVYGNRQEDYGSVSDNFSNIAKMWSVIIGKEVTKEQVGLCMCAVKIARQIYKPKRDNLVDLAGYAATLEKMERETSFKK